MNTCNRKLSVAYFQSFISAKKASHIVCRKRPVKWIDHVLYVFRFGPIITNLELSIQGYYADIIANISQRQPGFLPSFSYGNFDAILPRVHQSQCVQCIKFYPEFSLFVSNLKNVFGKYHFWKLWKLAELFFKS